MPSYTWPDGSKGHSIPWAQHLRNTGQVPHSSPAGYVLTDPAAIQTVADHPAPGVQSPAGYVQTDPAAIQRYIAAHTPGAPAPAAPTGVTPQPFDPGLAEQGLIAGRNIALADSGAAYDTGNLGFDYGYNPDGTVNTANPYSRAALYQLAYTNSKRATTNGMAAQGQLYSGAYGHQQGLNDQSYAQNEAANRLAYQRAIHGVQTGRLAAYANAGSDVGNTDFASLLKATFPGG